MAECTTCVFYNRQSRRCGAYDMPAEIARARPLLCGDAGADHRPRGAPRGESAFLIILTVLVLACLFALHRCETTTPATQGTDHAPRQ